MSSPEHTGRALSSRLRPTLCLWLGAVCISFAPVFVKLAGSIGPTMVGFYRCFFGSLLLLPAALLTGVPGRAETQRLPRAFWAAASIAGFAFAVDMFIWNRSVILAGAALATILANTQVFYLAIFGIIVFKDSFSFGFVMALFAAFGGIFLLTRPASATAASVDYWMGVIFGLGSGIAYACFLFAMRVAEKSGAGISTRWKLLLVTFIAAFFLFLAALSDGFQIPEGLNWLWLFALALVAQVFGWLLLTQNLPHVPMSRAGLILLTQPAAATLWGALLFGERLGFIQLSGAGITLTAIYVATVRKSLP